MKKIKYLFVFMAVGLLFGACSKDNTEPDPEIEVDDLHFGKYSVKIEFDDDGFDPEWLIDFSGGIGSSEKKMEIEGHDFDVELDEEVLHMTFYTFHFESFMSVAKKEYLLNFKQKSAVLYFIMGINGVEDISPSGKVK